MNVLKKIDYGSLDDEALASLIADRDPGAVRLVTQRNNQRLFRAAWSILGNRAEAEDAVQSAYLRAFAAIASFEGRSTLSTWLTRIVINEALGRARAARRRRAHVDDGSVAFLDDYREKLMRGSSSGTAPDAEFARAQLRSLLEQAIGALPPDFRLVFVMREIEGLSVDETAQSLAALLGQPQPADDVSHPDVVRQTRHLRARRRLQQSLAPDVKSALAGAFPFAGADCVAITEAVVSRFCGDAEPGTGCA